MTEKQKVLAVVGIALVAIAFLLIYRKFSSQKNVTSVSESLPLISSSPSQTPAPSSGDAAPASSALPVMPDGVADDILENDADISALDDEANGEVNAAKENSQIIDDITSAYDAKQL